MSPDLDDILVKKYPKIFKDRYADKLSTAMCWGFQCGDGWFWLIDNLCDSVQRYIDNNSHLKVHQVVATTVKEKFGTLSFYYNGGDDTINGMVWFAEHLSSKICEECGSSKDVGMTQGWIMVLCEKCSKSKKHKNRVWEKLEDEQIKIDSPEIRKIKLDKLNKPK